MLQLDADEVGVLATELIDTGLAEDVSYNHLRLHPALCPYLLGELTEAEQVQAVQAWAEGMATLANYLYEQAFKDTHLAFNLALLELPNLLSMLKYLQQTASAKTVVELAIRMEGLLQNLGRPAALVQVAALRETAAARLGEWSNARFEAERSSIERTLQSRQWQQSLYAAQELLQRSLDAGEDAYPGADYDITIAYILLGRVLKMVGRSQAALVPLAQAQARFQAIAASGNRTAAIAASTAIIESGDCLRDLGRLELAARAYQEAIQRKERLDDRRGAATSMFQLGTVRLFQQRYSDSLQAYRSACAFFEQLGEPGSVAAAWHQIGMVHRAARNFEAAEAAYRKALAIRVQYKLEQDEAASLNELGTLYNYMGRLEEAVAFSRQAVDIYARIHDLANEGRCHNNIAVTLIKLQHFDEGRRELQGAIECNKPFGHAATPWVTWDNLRKLEQADGNPIAAANASAEAIRAYLVYRQAGGENQNPGAQLCTLVAQAIQKGETTALDEMLTDALKNDITPDRKAVVLALQAILSGSRDAALAEGPDLRYDDAVELRLLLEELGNYKGGITTRI